MLAVLAIYVFAVVTFLVFTDPTEADKGDGPPCGTFYQCMGAHMLTGIMGDISSLFNSDLWDTGAWGGVGCGAARGGVLGGMGSREDEGTPRPDIGRVGAVPSSSTVKVQVKSP